MGNSHAHFFLPILWLLLHYNDSEMVATQTMWSKAKNIYYLALYQKILLTPSLVQPTHLAGEKPILRKKAVALFQTFKQKQDAEGQTSSSPMPV